MRDGNIAQDGVAISDSSGCSSDGVVAEAHDRHVVVANIGTLVEKTRQEAVPVVWVQHRRAVLGDDAARGASLVWGRAGSVASVLVVNHCARDWGRGFACPSAGWRIGWV